MERDTQHGVAFYYSYLTQSVFTQTDWQLIVLQMTNSSQHLTKFSRYKVSNRERTKQEATRQ